MTTCKPRLLIILLLAVISKCQLWKPLALRIKSEHQSMNPLQVNIDLSIIHFGQVRAPLSIMTIRLHFQIYKLEIIISILADFSHGSIQTKPFFWPKNGNWEFLLQLSKSLGTPLPACKWIILWGWELKLLVHTLNHNHVNMPDTHDKVT